MYSYIQEKTPVTQINIFSSTTGSSSDPNVFGPPLWFTLHNSSVTYPENPTAFIQNTMINLLTSLHLLIPCQVCKEHFVSYLATVNLKDVTKSRESLFIFFVNIHNYVNNRYNKPQMTIKEAKQLYGFDSPHGSVIRIKY